MSDIAQFHNIHAGATMLLVGNGENLKLTPPEWFDYPSIGMNTIHLYTGWKPTYYVAVDRRVMREFGGAIMERFADIPKFKPNPKLQSWQGANFYSFANQPGPIWGPSRGSLWQNNLTYITYGNVMHAAIKLAWWMGVKTILIIGMEHKPDQGTTHFWGIDEKMPAPPLADWLTGYAQLTSELKKRGVRVLNVSANTYVPDAIIPRDHYQNWI